MEEEPPVPDTLDGSSISGTVFSLLLLTNKLSLIYFLWDSFVDLTTLETLTVSVFEL